MKIKRIIFDERARLPERGHYNDAGADVFALDKVVIPPNSVVRIPLGFGLCMPDGFSAYLLTKSSLASKGITNAMPPIDPGYRGEINAIMHNTTNEPYVFEKGDKVAQLVVWPTIYIDIVDDLGEERGEGAFGSTGK